MRFIDDIDTNHGDQPINERRPPKPSRPVGRPPGGPGHSNRDIKYECTCCKKAATKQTLTAKRVAWLEIGMGGKTLRSRTVGWLCDECRDADPDWNKEARVTAPGLRDVTEKRSHTDG